MRPRRALTSTSLGRAEPSPPQADSAPISVRKCRGYCTQLYHLLMPSIQNSPRCVTVPHFRKRSEDFFPSSLVLLPGEQIKSYSFCEERKLNYCFHTTKPSKRNLTTRYWDSFRRRKLWEPWEEDIVSAGVKEGLRRPHADSSTAGVPPQHGARGLLQCHTTFIHTSEQRRVSFLSD